MRVRIVAVWILGILAFGPVARAQAQEAPGQPAPEVHAKKPKAEPRSGSKEANEKAGELAQQSLKAFAAGDLDKAEDLLHEQLKLQPKNFVVYYNLACCRAMKKDATGGCDYLQQAIENGFCDIRQLRSDNTLNPLRGQDKFRQIMNSWPAILEARRDANLKGCEEIFKKGYANSFDERLRLAYRSAFDEQSAASAKAELAKLADWCDQNVISGMLDKGQMTEDAWVVVVLPNHQDFVRWVVSVYGPGAISDTSMIAGSYEHDAKRLVSMDLGATLRHEFFHVLHWRDMTRRGQMHPIWIMEGLCSLVEDYDVDAKGKLSPATSWRSNIVKRLEKVGNLESIEQIAKRSPASFSGSRPLANYAQSRTIFLYLWRQGKLKDWYATYTDEKSEAGYRADVTGVKAIESVFGKPIKDINKEYRTWVRNLPAVPEEIQAGMASLGLDIDAGNGEGPVVAGIDRRPNRPDLKLGDVITSIDHKATRDIAEMVRVLSGYKPGDSVEVTYRRGKLYQTTSVVLVAR